MLRHATLLPFCILLNAWSLSSLAAEPSAGADAVAAEQSSTNPDAPSGAESVSVGGPVKETPGSRPKEPANESTPSGGTAEPPSGKQGAAESDKAPQKTPAEQAKPKRSQSKTPKSKKPNVDGAKREAAPGEESSAAPSPQQRTLTPAMAALKERVRRTLLRYSRQTLSTQENTASDLLTFCLAFGCESEVHCAAAGKQINAITCLCWNYPCVGFQPLILSGGHVAARVGFGFQQQPGELLAVFAQSRVPASYPVRVAEEVRTVADLVEYEKRSIRSGTDLSLQLIGLTYYVEEPTWKNDLGQQWSIEQILRHELERPTVATADGGTARLLALSYALDRRHKRRQPIDGEFLRAQQYVTDCQALALARQNADGSWGPSFFGAKAASANAAAQLYATGRMLEWLCFALAEDKLEDARSVRAVEYVCSLLDGQRYQWNIRSSSARDLGAIMHSLHALTIYAGRVFEHTDAAEPQ